MAGTAAILIARLIFAGVFIMAVTFKFLGMEDTAGYIASAGFPFPLFLAWVAAFFEIGLALAFLTGAFMVWAASLVVWIFLNVKHEELAQDGPPEGVHLG